MGPCIEGRKLEDEKMIENIWVRMKSRRNRNGTTGQTEQFTQIENITEESQCTYTLAQRLVRGGFAAECVKQGIR